MPMNFPDYDSIKNRGKMWKFREPNPGETEESYRNALADFVQPKDLIESCEIKNKTGWDKWNQFEKMDVITRGMDKK